MNPGAKDSMLARLKTIEGHIRGIARMLEEGSYCIDIITQTLAIQRAIDKLNREILENHLQTCVVRAMQSRDGSDRERVIKELLDVFEASAKI